MIGLQECRDGRSLLKREAADVMLSAYDRCQAVAKRLGSPHRPTKGCSNNPLWSARNVLRTPKWSNNKNNVLRT